MSTFLKFVWVAFVQYWGVWVTGTGITGLLLFLLSLAQSVTGRTMKPRHYFIVLFCVFWFLGTFSAWRDANKNLEQVIQQRARDVGDLGICRSDLRVSQTRTGDLQTQIDRLESTISSDQNIIAGAQKGVNEAQGSVNTCFISLGKANIPPPLNISNHATSLSGAPAGKNVGIIVAETNRRIPSFTGIVRCEQPGFALIQAGLLQGVMSFTPGYRQSPGQKEVVIDFSNSSWDVGQPIVAVVVGDTALDVSRCVIVQK